MGCAGGEANKTLEAEETPTHASVPPEESRDAHDWGPLAVISDDDATGGAAARGGLGTLDFSEACVTLRLKDSERSVTLVWRRDDVAWDPDHNEIVFADYHDGEMRLSDGLTVEVGGTSTVNPSSEWVTKPSEDCPAELFTVHDLTLDQQVD